VYTYGFIAGENDTQDQRVVKKMIMMDVYEVLYMTQKEEAKMYIKAQQEKKCEGRRMEGYKIGWHDSRKSRPQRRKTSGDRLEHPENVAR